MPYITNFPSLTSNVLTNPSGIWELSHHDEVYLNCKLTATTLGIKLANFRLGVKHTSTRLSNNSGRAIIESCVTPID